MSGRRILLLTPRPPLLDSTSGGQRVMAQTIAGLARRHRIALAAREALNEEILRSHAAAPRIEPRLGVCRS